MEVPTSAHKGISGDFSPEEFSRSLKMLKTGKAPGPDSICLELIAHADTALKFWLNNFLSFCMRQLKIPKLWRKALVVAIPKPMKPPGEAKSYGPTSLLCVSFKIMEKLIYYRVKPIVNPLLSHVLVGFRRGRSTIRTRLPSGLKELRIASRQGWCCIRGPCSCL